MRIDQPRTLIEKLNILSDAAKYDVACTSSGTDRGGSGQAWAIALQPGSVIPFLRMADAFRF